MTQKELLYVEDAIGHEQSVICILENILNNLEDSSLASFMSKQINKHDSIKEKMLKLLEDKSNE
ncbi:MAG: hypothetical protein IJH20_02075 [Bacilli bacterium]|nr:hypothetical protein [Bacilli bacterium]